MRIDVSVVVPTFNCLDDLIILISKIENQIDKPSEVIISDSSSNNKIQEFTKEYRGDVTLRYVFSKNKYPGEKRNLGAKYAQSQFIAFLDVGTLPKESWLKYSYSKIQEGFDVVFGSTKYNADNNFKKLLRAATFGTAVHETAPGSIISKQNFLNSGGFVENIRAGDDFDWKHRLKRSLRCFTPEAHFLEYKNLPNSLPPFLKKYLIYYIHSGKLSVLRNTRHLYLSAFLILSALIIPRWNFLIGGWESNPFFIPNITKIYILSFLFISFSYIMITQIFSKIRSEENLLIFIIKIISFVMVFLSVYFWNAKIANWVEQAALYIPHITKIYISSLLLASILYRGIYRPIKLKIDKDFLFPLNWIRVGLIGLSLEIIKIPGTLLGVILSPFTTQKIKRIK